MYWKLRLYWSLLLFFQEYSYLGEGECDVPAMSHVLAISHVSEMVCQPTLVGNGCQRWLAMDANGGWQWTPTVVGNGCQRWLAKSCDLDKYI
jgi:hypothetical protein